MDRNTDEMPAVTPDPLGRQGQRQSEPRVVETVPGTERYDRLFEQLWEGKISYDQFIAAIHQPAERAD